MKRNHTKNAMRHIRYQRGFSLVEIMVALTLSLILLAGVLAVMYSSKVTYMENERVGRLQENGRAALEMILRDLRGAGFPGCAQPIEGLFEMTNTLSDATTVPWNLTESTYGFEGSAGTWTPTLDAALFPDATAGNDIIVVRTIPIGAPSMRVSTIVNPTDDIEVSRGADEVLEEGTPAIISDCANASVFVVNGFAPDGETATISRSTGGGPPANTTEDLGATFAPGARVSPITSIAYYVAPNAAGTGPALWRVVSDGAPQELIPGVEALEVRYGVDTDTEPDVTVDEYVDADEVTDWSRVISVTLALLVRSAEENAKIVDERVYELLETDVGPFDDRFQRSLFTTTVTLRNRTT
ncbi:MAG TPA: PilW family protein [Steroidobacteraceae bacterium]|nr:PilW family protein [Steroidobacteraceae bacterium]